MSAIASITIALAILAGQSGSRPILRLKVGDTVTITGPYGGDFTILRDGAIYGKGFGRLALEGKTWSDGQGLIRKALKKYVREEVFLVLKDIRRDVVYLVGMHGGKGPVERTPDLTLRQLLSAAEFDQNADQIEAQLFRSRIKLRSVNVGALLAGSPSEPDQTLEAEDVVSLSPVPFVRVWVTGQVATSGQLKLPAGTDAYRAIAQAGGFKAPDGGALQDEGRVSIRRGPDVIELPLRQEPGSKSVPLESGDTIIVSVPEALRVTIAGEIVRPGELSLRGDYSLVGALSKSGGPTPEGTLRQVMVMRRGELYQIDASPPTTGGAAPTFQLEAGDLVFVQRNESAFQVLGEVANPRRVMMLDRKTYRLSDALAEAGGLTSKGSYRRIYVARPDASGKVQIQQYNLDEYLKDGRIASNPELQPGDSILFGMPKGLTMGSILQLLSGATMAGALNRR